MTKDEKSRNELTSIIIRIMAATIMKKLKLKLFEVLA